MSHVETITLQSEGLSLEVVASRGGRITRLVDRRVGREWLTPARAGGSPMLLDAVYTETDHGGWDEMMPTIEPCVYRGDPYDQVALPDHGELWTASWEVLNHSDTMLHQRAVGRRLNFSFQRLLEVSGSTLRCSYRCETPVDTVMLWAAHPQFAASDGTRLELWPTPDSLLEGSLGALRERPWSGDLVVERDLDDGTDLMLYADPDEPLAAATLTDPSGASLSMTWDTQANPYLAIWADRGRYAAGRVIAIEPTNGFVDDVAWARANGRVTVFEAEQPRNWWVEITLASGGDGAK